MESLDSLFFRWRSRQYHCLYIFTSRFKHKLRVNARKTNHAHVTGRYSFLRLTCTRVTVSILCFAHLRRVYCDRMLRGPTEFSKPPKTGQPGLLFNEFERRHQNTFHLQTSGTLHSPHSTLSYHILTSPITYIQFFHPRSDIGADKISRIAKTLWKH